MSTVTDTAVAVVGYAKRFFDLAKSKLTTYIALMTAGLSELLGSWEQSVALFPHWLVDQKQHIVAASALLAIWSRIRKEL